MKITNSIYKIKEAIATKMDEKLLKKNISTLVDEVNNFIPKGKNAKQELVLLDDTMLDSLEELLKYAKENNINIIKILELKKNLASFYLGMGVVRFQELSDWLMDNKDEILQNNLTNHTQALYAEFLVLIGVYEYFIKADYVTAMKNLIEAENIIINLAPEYEDLKYMVYSQLAQAYTCNADMKKSLEYIKKAKSTDTEALGIELETLLLKGGAESKYYLLQGNYEMALKIIDEIMDSIKDHPVDYYFAPVYVLKATTLNNLGNCKEAYNIVKPIYDKEIKEISSGNAGGIRLRVIIELARAKLGMDLKKEALRHAKQAIKIYTHDESRNNFNLDKSIDTDLADAFIIQADALHSLKETKKAIDSYVTAEVIYYNKYKQNITNLDEVSFLYKKTTFAAHSIKDIYSFNKFKKKHIDRFGVNHFRSKEILKLPDL